MRRKLPRHNFSASDTTGTTSAWWKSQSEMPRKMTSKHNFWGGPSGPPGFVPVIDSGELWTDESLHNVCGFRLNKDELLPVIEAMGHEPLGRYGNFIDGSEYFWAFPTEEESMAAMERACAKLLEIHPKTAKQTAPKTAPKEKPSGPVDIPTKRRPIMSDDELFALAEERGVAPIVIIIDQLME